MDRTTPEWLEFGVAYVWVIDSQTLESILPTSHSRVFLEDATLKIPEAGIEVPLRDLDAD